jgi:uncharacterized membrane protein YphA (DoxX/SURF4 family)
MTSLWNRAKSILEKTSGADFIAPLALRLYLAPVFFMAGTMKLSSMEGTIAWFDSLGIPFPVLNAYLAALTETVGAGMLLIGLGVRIVSIPMMFTMVIAAITVHLKNGWLAIAEGPGNLFATERTIQATERLEVMKEILAKHGDYQWLTAFGDPVILNNGVEFVATYFLILLTLFFIGGGEYISLDYWIGKKLKKLG